MRWKEKLERALGGKSISQEYLQIVSTHLGEKVGLNVLHYQSPTFTFTPEYVARLCNLPLERIKDDTSQHFWYFCANNTSLRPYGDKRVGIFMPDKFDVVIMDDFPFESSIYQLRNVLHQVLRHCRLNTVFIIRDTSGIGHQWYFSHREMIGQSVIGHSVITSYHLTPKECD